jgi:protein SCO1/2
MTIPWLRRAALCSTLLLAAACGHRGGAPAPSGARSEIEERAEASDFSVYELDAVWRDQQGRERKLASLAGRTRVLAMVYTNCGHTCPRIIEEFKRLEAGLSAEERERAGFVLVSLDPRRDTPEQLAHFAHSVRLDSARWTLLTGNDDSVRELAALLGIRYRPEAGGEISHSNSYLVLDAQGHIVSRRDGLDGDPEEALEHLQEAIDAPRPHSTRDRDDDDAER